MPGRNEATVSTAPILVVQSGHFEQPAIPQANGRAKKNQHGWGLASEYLTHLLSLLPEMRASDFHTQEVASQLVESTLLRMLRTPPDPYGRRSKQAAKVRKAKKKRFNNKAVVKAFRARGKSTDIPYLFGTNDPTNELLLLVHRCVPEGLPWTVRNDCCHDIIIDVLSGDLKPEGIQKAMQKYTRAALSFLPKEESQLTSGRKRGLHANAWKENIDSNYRPASLAEAIEELRQAWQSGNWSKPPRKPYGWEVMPTSRIRGGLVPRSLRLARARQIRKATP